MNQKSAVTLGFSILISALIISAAILFRPVAFRPVAGRYVLTHQEQNNLTVTDTTNGRIWIYSASDGKWRESLKRPWIDAE